jgi:hypothetical protein
MDKLTALLYFMLSLLGFDTGGNTLVHRTSVDGADTLHSRATVQAGVARFECLRSASGRCHYLVLPRDCMSSPASQDTTGCASRPVERFTLDDGDSRQITGLQNFRLCVSTEIAGHDCKSPQLLAAR